MPPTWPARITRSASRVMAKSVRRVTRTSDRCERVRERARGVERTDFAADGTRESVALEAKSVARFVNLGATPPGLTRGHMPTHSSGHQAAHS